MQKESLLPSIGVHQFAPQSKAVYSKITRRLVPLIFACYVAAYLDRVNVGFAKLRFAHDLGISETVYGIGAGVFFIGYILFEVPSNVILRRVGPKVWIARIMITWAIISGCMAFVNSPTTFYVLRFLLGVAEAGFIPGMLLYVTYWFPANRRGRITALFLAAIPVATVFGGPLSGWILQAFAGSTGLRDWQLLFVIEAIPSLVLGVLVLFLMDNSVEAAKWLTPDEKEIVRRDLEGERVGNSDLHSLGGAMRSARVWLLSVIYFTIALGIYVISFWLPTIIKGSGVSSPLAIGGLTAVPYVVAIVVMVFTCVHADRTGERRWHTIVPCVALGVGLVITALSLHNTVVALVGLTIAAAGASAAQAAFWCLPPTFLAGTAAAAGIALINSVGNISGVVSTSLVGWLSDVTGSNALSLSLFGVVAAVGGLAVLAVAASVVNDKVPTRRD